MYCFSKTHCLVHFHHLSLFHTLTCLIIMSRDTEIPGSVQLIEELNCKVDSLEFDKRCLLEVSIQRVICSYEVGLLEIGKTEN